MIAYWTESDLATVRCQRPGGIIYTPPKTPSIYVMGSLRNPMIPEVGNALRKAGFEAFDSWFAGGPIADDSWQEYEKKAGRTYKDALYGHAAKNIFEFDCRHLRRVDAGVLVLPAGKSAHIELGFMSGLGKKTYVLFSEGEPERWDVMYQFATDVFFSVDEMLEALKAKDVEEIR